MGILGNLSRMGSSAQIIIGIFLVVLGVVCIFVIPALLQFLVFVVGAIAVIAGIILGAVGVIGMVNKSGRGY